MELAIRSAKAVPIAVSSGSRWNGSAWDRLAIQGPLTSDAATASPTNAWTGRLLIVAVGAILPLAFMWRAPAALGLYWLTSSIFSLLERGFYRTKWGRRLLL